jgi:hypothetical protein
MAGRRFLADSTNPSTLYSRKWRARLKEMAANGIVPVLRPALANRVNQYLKRQRERIELLARAGFGSFAELREIPADLPEPRPALPVQEPDPPPPLSCQWIEAEAPYLAPPCFCGRPAVPGYSWCLAHRERVYLGDRTAWTSR